MNSVGFREYNRKKKVELDIWVRKDFLEEKKEERGREREEEKRINHLQLV